MRQVLAELGRLRRRSQGLLVAQRSSVILAWTLAVTCAAVVVDFLLRLPAGARLVLLLAGGAALLWAIWRRLLPALWFRPSLTHVALRVERLMPGMAGRLASSVEFAAAGEDQTNPLAARSVQDAQSRLAGESMLRAIAPRRTWLDVGVMLLVAAVVVAAATIHPPAASIGLSRLLLPFGAAQWPARTGVQSLMDRVAISHRAIHASTSRGTQDGDAKGDVELVHPRGTALPLRARVTAGPADQRVQAHYRLQVEGRDEPWQHALLTHQSQGVHERLVDSGASGAQAIDVYFSTADSRTSLERIALVPPPAVVRATLEVTAPDYATGRVPAFAAELGPGVDARAVTERPSLIGSAVTLRLELNKPLPVPREPESGEARAWLTRTLSWSDVGPRSTSASAQPAPPPLELSPPTVAADESTPSKWTVRWTLQGSRQLEVRLVDEHGLSNREPIAYRIDAVDDVPPTVVVTRPPVDEAVLPTAVVELTAEARDDVAVQAVGMEAMVQRPPERARSISPEEPADAEVGAEREAPPWMVRRDADAPVAIIEAPLDLATLQVVAGDVVQVRGVAQDLYEIDGRRHDTQRSAPRSLRVISETELITQMRRDLSAVRQQAIRLEGMQAELQEDLADSGVRPGVARAQAQIVERLAEQQQTIGSLRQRARSNRLDDSSLSNLLDQSTDLLDAAGQAASRAVSEIERRDAAARPEAAEVPPHPADDQPILDQQQTVRDELADLIQLLDRDEDSWVVTRQLETMLEAQRQLEQQTADLEQQTLGRSRSELTPLELTELDRIVQSQFNLADQARALLQQMRERARELESVDPQSAAGLRMAANTGEQQELGRNMEAAAQQAQSNQLRNAQAGQEAARETMEQMQQDVDRPRRARAEELQRRLASLVESIQRLIVVQEGELSGLAGAEQSGDFSGRDRAMMRLQQNTQAVAAEARAAGPEVRRVARLLDRAADAQAESVMKLRAQPPLVADARAAQERALELLEEAKGLAEQTQEQAAAQARLQQIQELIAAYRVLAEKQVAARGQTLTLAQLPELDRRQLIEARMLGGAQEEIRNQLNDLHSARAEVADARVFSHVHRMMDQWARSARDGLQEGRVGPAVTDRQQQIADSIGRLMVALEDSAQRQREFAEGQSGDGGGGGGGEPPPMIPPIAELRLIRGMQEQVYDQTRELDQRSDLAAAESAERARELGRLQRDLRKLGQELLDALRSQGGPAPDSAPDSAPDASPGGSSPQ